VSPQPLEVNRLSMPYLQQSKRAHVSQPNPVRRTRLLSDSAVAPAASKR
jgi:hypothetical protein